MPQHLKEKSMSTILCVYRPNIKIDDLSPKICITCETKRVFFLNYCIQADKCDTCLECNFEVILCRYSSDFFRIC